MICLPTIAPSAPRSRLAAADGWSWSTGRRQHYWVRKSDGLGIRLIDSTGSRIEGVREVVLIGN